MFRFKTGNASWQRPRSARLTAWRVEAAGSGACFRIGVRVWAKTLAANYPHASPAIKILGRNSGMANPGNLVFLAR